MNNEIIDRLEKLDMKLSELLKNQSDVISVEQFRLNIPGGSKNKVMGTTTLHELIKGTHSSGFQLKTFKPAGSRVRFTYRSEITRFLNLCSHGQAGS